MYALLELCYNDDYDFCYVADGIGLSSWSLGLTVQARTVLLAVGRSVVDRYIK